MVLDAGFLVVTTAAGFLVGFQEVVLDAGFLVVTTAAGFLVGFQEVVLDAGFLVVVQKPCLCVHVHLLIRL